MTTIEAKEFTEMELPSTIYKYRTWTDKYHQKIITDRQVYLARPTSFEDILDCKGPIRYDLLSEAERMNWMIYQLQIEFPNRPYEAYLRMAKQLYPTSAISDNGRIKEIQDQEFVAYDERMGVLSLTANSMNPSMWKKYSEDFKGICVGFNPIVMFEHLGGGGIVEYVTELPVIYPEPRHSYIEQMMLQVYFKEKKWEFEEEYRTHKFRVHPLSNEERTITLPAEAYKEILIGPAMPPNHREQLFASLSKELSHVKVIELKAGDFPD